MGVNRLNSVQKATKSGLWNTECGDAEYVYRSSCEHPTGCDISGWSERQWCGYSAHQKVPKETCKSHKTG